MIPRRILVRCAAVLVLSVGVTACATPKLPSFFSGSKKGKGYQGPGKRIDVLTAEQKLEVSEALKGVGFSLPAPQTVADWPLPGGVPEQSIEHVDAAPQFQIAWRRKIGAGESRGHHVTATPVIADNRIYVMDGEAGVSARDLSSGAEIWRVDLSPRKGRDREAYGGGVAYSDGVLFVSSGFRFVAALDARTGAQKWRTTTPAPVHGAPTVSGGRVFVVDVGDQLSAFDTTNGTEVWDYQALEEPARMLAASSPAITGDTVVAPFASGELVALRATNGNELWSDVLSFTNRNNALSEIRDISGRPIIYRGDVLAGSHSGAFAAINLRTGQRRWSLPITTITTPWGAGDVVFITDQFGKVICASRESGQVYWIVDLNAAVKKVKNRATWSGPILASNRLVLVSDKGEAIALDPQNGERKASIKLGSSAFLSPIAAGGRLYVLTDEAQLIAIQ